MWRWSQPDATIRTKAENAYGDNGMTTEPTRTSPPVLKPENRIKALEYFKDWTNALMVATVAGIGWVATASSSFPPSVKHWTTGLLGLSLIFGILSLALVPLITEYLDDASS